MVGALSAGDVAIDTPNGQRTKNWFQRHLNTTLALYGIVICIVIGIAHAATADDGTMSGELFWDSVGLIITYTLGSIIFGIVPAIVVNGNYYSEPFTTFNILLLIIASIIICITIGWCLMQKNRSLVWLLLLFVPFGIVVISRLLYENKDD